MFDKLFKNFDNFDADKLLEVVNLVWNNRDKIMDLVESLPKLLQDTGQSIELAGESTLKASLLLTGDKETPGVNQIAGMAAVALERAQKEIAAVARAMDKIGNEIDDIRIPSVEPKYTEVMGFNVVSGLDFGESQLVDNAADRLKGGSDRLEGIGEDLRSVAKHLRDLGGALDHAGGDLGDVGSQLKESGQTLRSLTHMTNFK